MKKILCSLTALSLFLASVPAQAGIHRDSHGNVGYDTLQECQAAISSGNATFYKSHTHKPPLLRKGEVKVSQTVLGKVNEAYRMGTCDIGTGHRAGRDGVAKALQGKYIPYSPEMPVNQYADASGRIVRVTMQQCDNWFSNVFPKATMFNPTATLPAQVAPVSQPVIPAVVAPTAVPALAPAVTPAVTTAATTAVTTATTVATTAATTATTAAGAVAAAEGAMASLLPLSILGAIGIGTAVLMNSDSSSGISGTTGTTGTR